MKVEKELSSAFQLPDYGQKYEPKSTANFEDSQTLLWDYFNSNKDGMDMKDYSLMPLPKCHPAAFLWELTCRSRDSIIKDNNLYGGCYGRKIVSYLLYLLGNTDEGNSDQSKILAKFVNDDQVKCLLQHCTKYANDEKRRKSRHVNKELMTLFCRDASRNILGFDHEFDCEFDVDLILYELAFKVRFTYCDFVVSRENDTFKYTIEQKDVHGGGADHYVAENGKKEKYTKFYLFRPSTAYEERDRRKFNSLYVVVPKDFQEQLSKKISSIDDFYQEHMKIEQNRNQKDPMDRLNDETSAHQQVANEESAQMHQLNKALQTGEIPQSEEEKVSETIAKGLTKAQEAKNREDLANKLKDISRYLVGTTYILW